MSLLNSKAFHLEDFNTSNVANGREIINKSFDANIFSAPSNEGMNEISQITHDNQ